MIPTIEQMAKTYPAIARAERAKTGRPCPHTVQNVLRGTAAVLAAARLPPESPADALTRKNLDAALSAFIARGCTRITAWTFLCQLRGLFARWTLPYWKDLGWETPPPELPAFRARPPRYLRPAPSLLADVKTWYSSLPPVQWFAATMMLEYAMRNGDVLRLAPANFPQTPGGVYLSYTPRKTELTSGRRVHWPVHPEIWARIQTLGGLPSLSPTRETFAEMNRSLRALGFTGPKASYELRKICIDHVYQNFGAEMAVSISGDDIRTITRYYADPAQPNPGPIRITSLI